MQKSLSEWDDAAQWYDQNMGEAGDELNATIIRPLLLEMLGDISGASLLDAGCGSGYVAAELARAAARVVGTDFAPHFVTLCQQKYHDHRNMKFAVQDIEQPFSFGDASFDAVVCKMVLQYVPDIQPFARETLRMLKRGGELIVIVDHPFRAAYFQAQQDAGDGTEDIFSDKPKTKLSLWGKTELTWYARTTSVYVQCFIDVGFRLIDMREPHAGHDSPIPFSVLALKFVK